ncbi:MAG TPA: RHS repeat domain-containing protein, partial [Allosphingosinicella sp.]|nr:RHS repeat domain-containing protein [Allosphingosinicella sp.]
MLTVTQVSKTQGLANRVTTYTYTPVPTGNEPPAGLVATEQDPRGITTAYSYTHHGQVSQIVYAQGTADQTSVSMTYDANDNPTRYTNELSATTLTTYDNLDRLVSTTLPAPNPSQPSIKPVYTQVWDARNRKIESTDA